jgi:uncharacterized membrane protein
MVFAMSGWYKLFVVLHLVTVVVGIGGVVLNGVYASIAAKRKGPEGLAVSEANFTVSMLAEKFIYAIPVFGILAILASDEVWAFDQTWIWMSIVLYVVAMGIAHGVLIPGHRRINELSTALNAGRGGPAEASVLEATARKMAPAGAAVDLLAVVLIILMVWKPGV